MASEPEIIGDLHGVKVLIDRTTRSVYLAHTYFPPLKFSIDHPDIQGSRLERDARSALDAPLASDQRGTG
jgi:hypothetical protein